MSLFGVNIEEMQQLINDISIDEKEIKNSNGQNNPLEVTIKEGQLNTKNIIDYKGKGIKKFEFRPQNFEQFIGQEKAKKRCKTLIKKHKKGLKSHLLIDGIKGHGKTTMVELLGKELNAKVIRRIGHQINLDDIVNIVNEINSSKEDTVILFVDEIDTTDPKILKVFNPIIESFKIESKNIKPFIFAGATINKHILLKNNPDTLDRISTHIKFEKYNEKHIEKIINQYKNQLYKDELIYNNDIKIISKNCKYNPRTSINLLEEYIVEEDIEEVLKNSDIIKDGLSRLDIKILQTLTNSSKPMGCNALALKVGISQKEYLTEFEPYLLEYDYINRIPSRVITPKGINFLKTI